MVVIKVGTAPLDCNKTEEVVITPEISVIRLSVITYPPLASVHMPRMYVRTYIHTYIPDGSGGHVGQVHACDGYT